MRENEFVQVRLPWCLCAFCLCLACGQKQNLHTNPPYPEIQRVVTIPDGFELWFNPSNKNKATLWLVNGDQKTAPIHFKTNAPLQISADEELTRVRYAYQSEHGIGSISPALTLRRTAIPRMPKITCRTESDSTQIHAQWSGKSTNRSERVMVRQSHKTLAVLSREISEVSITARSEELELEYENQRFRSARWLVSCP